MPSLEYMIQVSLPFELGGNNPIVTLMFSFLLLLFRLFYKLPLIILLSTGKLQSSISIKSFSSRNSVEIVLISPVSMSSYCISICDKQKSISEGKIKTVWKLISSYLFLYSYTILIWANLVL